MARDLRHYRYLYTHRRWREKRRHQLAIEPMCRICMREGRTTFALVADHVIPHKGNLTKFWTGPLQSLCKHCHDSRKQQQERRGFMRGCGSVREHAGRRP